MERVRLLTDDPKFWNFGITILLVLLLVMCWNILTTKNETLVNPVEPDITKSWVKLYENFKYSGPGLTESEVGTWIYESSGPLDRYYQRRDLKINLKSYDINVTRGNVQLWAIYPNEPVASSVATGVAGYGSAYEDPIPWAGVSLPPIPTTTVNAYQALDMKYKKIVEVKSGERIRGSLDFPAKRVMVLINLN